MVDITIVNGVYKPTYNWGAKSCITYIYHIYIYIYVYIPSGNLTVIENGHRNSGFTHWKWVDLSIVMLADQRVIEL